MRKIMTVLVNKNTERKNKKANKDQRVSNCECYFSNDMRLWFTDNMAIWFHVDFICQTREKSSMMGKQNQFRQIDFVYLYITQDLV